MPALAKRFTVLAPDLRGLGDSSRPDAGYDKRTVAQDIHNLVSQLGLGPVSIVGHDWGAPVAYAYAATQPDAARRVVMLAVGVPDDSLLKVPLGPLLSGTGLWHFVFHAVRSVPELLVAGHEREYLDWFYHSLAFDYSNAFDPNEVDEYVRAYTLPGAMHASFEYYRAVPQDIEDNRRFAQSKLKVPVLFVVGEGGGLDYTLAQLKGLIEDVRGFSIPQCGHWIASEHPEELIAQLVPFLTSNEET
jgi:pimeloyl-ACP methyl ester carboxylesterase